MLLNIYPNAEIYFANAPYHVATGIKIENKLYMLDQRLPILTKDRWNDYRKPKKSDKIERIDPIKKTLEKATFPQTKDKPELNTEELAKRITELLNIEKQQDDKANSLQKSIPWKKGAILYEDDEMVDYSLARWLETRISRQLIRIDQITRIEINCHEDDPMIEKDDVAFLIHFSHK